MLDDRCRACEAGSVDRLCVGACVGSQIESERCGQGDATRRSSLGLESGGAPALGWSDVATAGYHRSLSSPNRSRQRSRGTQNQLKIGPRALSGRPVAPKSVLEASRELLRSISGRPRVAPGAPGG